MGRSIEAPKEVRTLSARRGGLKQKPGRGEDKPIVVPVQQFLGSYVRKKAGKGVKADGKERRKRSREEYGIAIRGRTGMQTKGSGR